MTRETLSTLFSGLSGLLKAGIPLQEGIDLLIDEGEDEAFIEKIAEGLKEYKPIEQVCETVDAIPQYSKDVIKIGAKAGRLEEALEGLSLYYERMDEISQSIRTILMYPIILSTMLLGIILILILKVTPLIEGIYKNLGEEIAYVWRSFLPIYRGMGIVVILLLSSFIAMILFIGYWFKQNQFPKWLNKLFIRSKLAYDLSLVKVLFNITLLVKSGLSFQETFEEVKDITNHPFIYEKIHRGCILLEAHTSLIKTLQNIQLFSPIDTKKLSIAYYTGHLDETLSKIVTEYENKLDEKLNILIGRIEFISVTVLALIMGGMLLTIILPLIRIMSLIG